MGVAGGELLIPTLVLLFGVDIKLAGSLSFSCPSDHDGRLRPLQPGPGVLGARGNVRFLMAMAAGSVVSAASSVGCSWASFPHLVLIPTLALLLLLSAVRLWRHQS